MGMGGRVGFAPAQDGFGRLLGVLGTDRSRPLRWNADDVVFGAFPPVLFSHPEALPDIVVMVDGALHNESDLRATLGGVRGGPAELIAHGYARWGLDVIDRMIGEFAFALWDGTARRLVLARDALGMRPLFYWHAGERLMFASSTRALHADPLVPREIDPEQAARTLLSGRLDHPRTAFRDIERVVAGHAAIFENGACRQIRWWRPEALPAIRLRNDKAYEDALRDLLDQAVADRLPSAGPVALTLSGGLDSSAIAALAARRLASQGRRLTAFTLVPAGDETPDFPGCVTNEGPTAAVMQRSYDNIDHILIRHDVERDLFDVTETRNRYSDHAAPRPFTFANFDRLYAAAGKQGCSVVLEGAFGNQTISHDGLFHLYDVLRRGDIAGWLGLLPGLRRAGFGWKRLLGLSFGPALPPATRHWLAKLSGTRTLALATGAAINPDFAREIGMMDHDIQHQYDDATDSRRHRLLTLNRMDRGVATDYFRRRYGVTSTDPTGDRRVLEFCLAIPEEQFIRQGRPRSLIRRAMRGMVPDSILDARNRGLQCADRHVALLRSKPRILEELARMERSPLASRCLNLAAMRRLTENWPAGGWDRAEIQRAYCVYLANGLALGHFLRRFEGGNS